MSTFFGGPQLLNRTTATNDSSGNVSDITIYTVPVGKFAKLRINLKAFFSSGLSDVDTISLTNGTFEKVLARLDGTTGQISDEAASIINGYIGDEQWLNAGQSLKMVKVAAFGLVTLKLWVEIEEYALP